MSEDPLQYIPVEKWLDLEQIFKLDWPRGIPGYALLQTQKRWLNQGIEYNMKVYCPFGKVQNGMVAIHERSDLYGAVIQCPSDNTEYLENALKNTHLINWKKEVVIPFCSPNVIECLKRVIPEDHPTVHLAIHHDLNIYILNRKTPFEDVSLPSGVTFGLLTPEYAALVDAPWPHRYPDSESYFKLLINNKCGYALYVDNNPISWVFINEVGMLMHTYTVEEHRKKGYAELLYKLVYNILLKEDRHMFGFVLKDNIPGQKLHEKAGFTKHHTIAWIFSENKVQ